MDEEKVKDLLDELYCMCEELVDESVREINLMIKSI